MTLVFLYAGQGSQKPGMGRDFYEEYPEVQDIFDCRPMGIDIKSLCFDADMATLSRTEHTQPCMGAFAVAVTRLLEKNGVTPKYSMGLSLGEYGALYAAKAITDVALIDVLAFRGEAMASASKDVECAMAAVLNLENSEIERAVKETGGNVWCCNYNCPGQTVIGGERRAVEAAAARCLELGARRCLPLNVSGPFHTPYMEPAAEKLREKINKVKIKEPKIPVVFNATGTLRADGETVENLLVTQIKSPVKFEQGIRTLVALGVDIMLEIGPGNILSGFVKKTAPQIKIMNIETTANFRNAVAILSEYNE